jgi:4-hydroxythreonine-4-phosphate dehydrogenase
LLQSAEVAGFSRAKLEKAQEYQLGEGLFSGLRLHTDFPRLKISEMRPGRPSKKGGSHQLSYIEAAFRIAKREAWPLSTAPVSKEVIAGCGVPRAKTFRGHTEWLEKLDQAPHSVMCFSCERLTTSLVTTHIPLRRVPAVLTSSLVVRATLELVDLLLRKGRERPVVAICSLNPHAGEGELLGDEENRAILPAVKEARRRLRSKARVVGPIGAETAYRKGASGAFDGVVAMYHDQATIPMKLLDFGGAVNITQGLSIVRTSVDHGTAYDIAGQGVADARGMREAILMARTLGASGRMIPHGSW